MPAATAHFISNCMTVFITVWWP